MKKLTSNVYTVTSSGMMRRIEPAALLPSLFVQLALRGTATVETKGTALYMPENPDVTIQVQNLVQQGHPGFSNVEDMRDLARRITQKVNADFMKGKPAPPYKRDEAALLMLIRFAEETQPVGENPRVWEIVTALDQSGVMHCKRAWYVLEKFTGWGLYDYGVSVDHGWLTDKGRDTADRFFNAPTGHAGAANG